MFQPHLVTPKGERIAVINGLRTPFVQKEKGFKDAYAADLGTMVTNELLNRTPIERQHIEQLVFGQVIQQPDIPNLSREIALSLNLPHLQAYTLSNSCISGLQAIINVTNSIMTGAISTGIAGGADSISNAPISLSPFVIQKIKAMLNAPTLEQKYALFKQLSWRDLKPHGVNLKDYLTQQSVADISEQMAQNFAISRAEQDEYALHSCQKAANAWRLGLLKEEVITSFPRPYTDFVVSDTLKPAASRKNYYANAAPILNKNYASVTEANMPSPADGAGAVLLMREGLAKALGLNVLGYIRSFALTGNDTWQNMLIGATLAASAALKAAQISLKDVDFIDIHESSASQVLANLRLFSSNHFAKQYLNSDSAIGEIDLAKLNHLGGSIAFGNPRAVTSLRLFIQSLHALRRNGGGLSLITASGLGGQGAAMVLESE